MSLPSLDGQGSSSSFSFDDQNSFSNSFHSVNEKNSFSNSFQPTNDNGFRMFNTTQSQQSSGIIPQWNGFAGQIPAVSVIF